LRHISRITRQITGAGTVATGAVPSSADPLGKRRGLGHAAETRSITAGAIAADARAVAHPGLIPSRSSTAGHGKGLGLRLAAGATDPARAIAPRAGKVSGPTRDGKGLRLGLVNAARGPAGTVPTSATRERDAWTRRVASTPGTIPDANLPWIE